MQYERRERVVGIPQMERQRVEHRSASLTHSKSDNLDALRKVTAQGRSPPLATSGHIVRDLIRRRLTGQVSAYTHEPSPQISLPLRAPYVTPMTQVFSSGKRRNGSHEARNARFRRQKWVTCGSNVMPVSMRFDSHVPPLGAQGAFKLGYV